MSNLIPSPASIFLAQAVQQPQPGSRHMIGGAAAAKALPVTKGAAAAPASKPIAARRSILSISTP
jgi:hypothetical protein